MLMARLMASIVMIVTSSMLVVVFARRRSRVVWSRAVVMMARV